MSIIEAIKNYISLCPLMDGFTGAHVDWTDETADNYGIVPSGDILLKRFLDGTEKRQYNATIFAKSATESDLRRIQNNAWAEQFAEWIRTQNLIENLPKGFSNITFERISADNNMLYSTEQSGQTSVYQIQLHIIYKKF